jgi:hypothetical protein
LNFILPVEVNVANALQQRGDDGDTAIFFDYQEQE